MSNTTCIAMLVCWKEQRGLIDVNRADHCGSIEKSIIESYQLENFQHFREYQIQYYDESYRTFVDLSPQTMECFRKVVEKLLSTDAPTKDHPIWQLRIIRKATATIGWFSNIEEKLGSSFFICRWRPSWSNSHRCMQIWWWRGRINRHSNWWYDSIFAFR